MPLTPTLDLLRHVVLVVVVVVVVVVELQLRVIPQIKFFKFIGERVRPNISYSISTTYLVDLFYEGFLAFNFHQAANFKP